MSTEEGLNPAPEESPAQGATPAPPGAAARGRAFMHAFVRALLRPLLAFFHEGAAGYIGFIALGLSLDLLCLPPGPLPLLVLMADAPLLWLLFHREGKRWKRWTYLYGWLHFAFATRWLSEIHPIQVVAVGTILGVVYLLLGFWIRFLAQRRVPFVLVVGVGVVLEEMLRTIWMGGMPWPTRSLSFAGDGLLDPGMVALVPATAFVGAYGLSMFAGMTSAVVSYLPGYWAARGEQRRRERRALLRAGLVPLLTLLGLMTLAVLRTIEHRTRLEDGRCTQTERSLVAVQGAIPQHLKHSDDPGQVLHMFDLHVSLSATAIRKIGREQVFAVLWPETMVPWPFLDADLAARFPEMWEHEVGVLRRLRADVPEGRSLDWLIGAIYQFRRGEERHVNVWDYGSHDSLFHLNPRHAPDMQDPTPRPPAVGERPAFEFPGGRHDKTKLVPGGEYTPLGEWLPPLRWVRNVVSVIPELDPGPDRQVPFQLRDEGREAVGESGLRVPVGTAICFEIAFPARCRALRRAGSAVLLNAANYGWFGRTGFCSQIQAIARLRAAELGITVVMAGNTGPTAFYDPLGVRYGSFQGLGDEAPGPAGGRETTYRPGWAWAPLVLDKGLETPYLRLGDWPWLALALLLVGLAFRPKGRASRRAFEGVDSPRVHDAG